MENQYDLSKFDKVLADVVGIQEQGNFLPDCTTKDGYEASKRFVLDVTTPARKALEEAHKKTKKPFWDACKFLDSKKKELMPLLEQIEAPHKEAYKAVDEEKKRIKAEKEALVQKGFDDINAMMLQSMSASSEEIKQLLDDCADFDLDPEVYGKRTDELAELQADAMGKLTDALTRQIQAEEMEAKRLEMERREREIAEKEAEQARIKAEAERKEREAKIAEEAKKEAAAQAKLEAERLAKENEERIEQEKQAALQAKAKAEQAAIDAIEREKQVAIAAEQKRLADVEAARQAEIARQQEQIRLEQEEAARNAADLEHVKRINNESLADFIELGLTENNAKAVVTAIAKGLIKNVTINY